jgi:hypothetical protein
MNHRIGGHCQSQNKITAETKTHLFESADYRAESFTNPFVPHIFAKPATLLKTPSGNPFSLFSLHHPITKFKSHSIMTSKRLLFLLGLTTSMNLSSSYTTSSLSPLASSEPRTISTPSTMRKPNAAVEPTNISQVLPIQQQQQQQQQQNEARPRVTYGLGLGKNQPVLGASCSTTANSVTSGEDTPEDVYHAVQFWSGHKTVHNIPSPYENLKRAEKLRADALSQSQAQSQAQSTKPKSSFRHIVPTRLAEDLVSISNHHHFGGEESRGPTMIGNVQAMDLNTPWVEMLIHEQQLKFA